MAKKSSATRAAVNRVAQRAKGAVAESREVPSRSALPSRKALLGAALRVVHRAPAVASSAARSDSQLAKDGLDYARSVVRNEALAIASLEARLNGAFSTAVQLVATEEHRANLLNTAIPAVGQAAAAEFLSGGGSGGTWLQASPASAPTASTTGSSRPPWPFACVCPSSRKR